VGGIRTTVHTADEVISAIRGSAGIKTTIAKRLNVSPATVSEIINGETYKHVERPTFSKRRTSTKRRDDLTDKVVSLYEAGFSYEEICEQLEIKTHSVYVYLKSRLGVGGFETPSQKKQRLQKEKALQLYSSGIDARTIAHELGVTYDCIRKQAINAGIWKPDGRKSGRKQD